MTRLTSESNVTLLNTALNKTSDFNTESVKTKKHKLIQEQRKRRRRRRKKKKRKDKDKRRKKYKSKKHKRRHGKNKKGRRRRKKKKVSSDLNNDKTESIKIEDKKSVYKSKNKEKYPIDTYETPYQKLSFTQPKYRVKYPGYRKRNSTDYQFRETGPTVKKMSQRKRRKILKGHLNPVDCDVVR